MHVVKFVFAFNTSHHTLCTLLAISYIHSLYIQLYYVTLYLECYVYKVPMFCFFPWNKIYITVGLLSWVYEDEGEVFREKISHQTGAAVVSTLDDWPPSLQHYSSSLHLPPYPFPTPAHLTLSLPCTITFHPSHLPTLRSKLTLPT